MVLSITQIKAFYNVCIIIMELLSKYCINVLIIFYSAIYNFVQKIRHNAWHILSAAAKIWLTEEL